MWIFESPMQRPADPSKESCGAVRRRGGSPLERHGLHALGTLLSLIIFSTWVFGGYGLYQVRELKPNVFAWIPEDVLDQDGDPLFSRAATAGFIITPEGVIVVDSTNSPFHAREVLYEIRRRTDAPVKYVVDTSAAGDHILGNEVFTDQRATIVSTPLAQAEMRRYRQRLDDRMDREGEEAWRLQTRMRGFHITPSTQTFDGEMTLHLNSEQVKVISLFRDGQLSADAVAYVPSAKVLFLGELFENGYFPRIDSRNIHRWIEGLRQMESWDVDTYVPAHGEPGGKKELADFRGFLEWLAGEVDAKVKEGKPLAEVKKEVVPLQTFHWHAPELAEEDVEAVYKRPAREIRGRHRGPPNLQPRRPPNREQGPRCRPFTKEDRNGSIQERFLSVDARVVCLGHFARGRIAPTFQDLSISGSSRERERPERLSSGSGGPC